MEEVHEFDRYTLVVQLVPETGENNFQYLIFDKEEDSAISIDCFDPAKVLNRLGTAKLIAALATHHHWDHVGGITTLAERWQNLDVIGGDQRIKGITKLISKDEQIKVGSLSIDVIQTPCHTTGSVCYYIPSLNSVFTGDTIFPGGVGRFFEGTADQMVVAVNKVKKLPPSTQIFPGHEYTVSNLTFAAHFDSTNQTAATSLAKAKATREKERFTVPSTIQLENQVNPFFRFRELRELVKAGSDDDSMRLIREAKNNFRMPK